MISIKKANPTTCVTATIEEQIRELYDFNVSTSTISRITDTITNDIIAWKNRLLEATYLIVCMYGWMDGWMELSLK